MTKDEMSAYMKSIGINSAFKVTWDTELDERGLIVFRSTGHLDKDGNLHGTVIDLQPGAKHVQVWTSSKKKAKDYADIHKLKVRLFDGEAMLYVLGPKADAVLPRFGAKVKRTPSPAQQAVLDKLRNSPSSFKKRPPEGGSSPVPPKGGV